MHEFDVLFNSLNTLIVKATKDGRFSYVNTYWEEVLGWSVETLTSEDFLSFVHPDDVSPTLFAFSRLTEKGEDVEGFRNRYRHQDGSYLWLEWTARILPTGDVAASAVPVNERIALEDHDKRATSLLSQAEQFSNIGHWSLNLSTEEVFWSDEVYRIHGVVKGLYIPNLQSAINFYHPDDVQTVQQHVNTAMREGTGWEFKLRIVRPDGEIRHIQSKAQIAKADGGRTSHVFGIFQDITDTVKMFESVRLLSKVAETSVTSVCITDKARRVTWVNQAFSALTGYALTDIKGKVLGDVLQGEHTSRDTIAEISTKLKQHKNVDVEILNYHKSGREYWINLLISPVFDGENITHYIGFQQDITQRKIEQVAEMNANRVSLVGEMSAGICHDLNNVLAIIYGNAELLLLADTLSTAKDNTHKIISGIERARRVTGRLLKTVKPGAESKSVFNPSDVLKGELQFYRDSIPASIQFESEFQANAVCHVDKGNFTDAVLNLIVNAHKAMPEKGKVTMSTKVVDTFDANADFIFAHPKDVEQFICVCVEDNGCGLAQSTLSEIFTPFYSTRSEQAGTGLGLCSVSAFVVNNKCGLTVDSKLNIGSRFTIWLPVYAAMLQGIEEKEQAGNESRDSSHNTIVIVDDEISILEVVSSLLKADGYTVHSFTDALEALEFIRENAVSIDAVISDQSMSGNMQGNELITWLKAHFPALPAAIMTGYSSSPVFDSLDVEVIQKPISFTELRSKVKGLVDGSTY